MQSLCNYSSVLFIQQHHSNRGTPAIFLSSNECSEIFGVGTKVSVMKHTHPKAFPSIFDKDSSYLPCHLSFSLISVKLVRLHFQTEGPEELSLVVQVLYGRFFFFKRNSFQPGSFFSTILLASYLTI